MKKSLYEIVEERRKRTVRRLRSVLVVTTIIVLLLATATPTVAQNASAPAKSTVFVPAQTVGNYSVPEPGGTLSCTGTPYSAPSGTCTPLGSGMIAEGQVCDTPTAVTVFGTTQLSAFVCHAPDATSAPDLTLVGPRVVVP
jgi:hypothetical protein